MTRFDPAAFLQDISQMVDSYAGPAPSVLFEVYRNGVSAEGAHGVVGFDDDTPATNDNLFEIGSQTKMMTAVVLLQLASEGALSLDDRLADVMDVTSMTGIENIGDVTLYQLLTHSSGIPDYLNDLPEIPDQVWEGLTQDPPQQFGPDEFLDLLNARNAPANFEPGTDTQYSNTGFLLLGMAITSVSGNSMAQEFQNRIFDPVGMTSTSLPGFARPEGILRSYSPLDDGMVDVTDFLVSSQADSGVVSSTGDMVRFMTALAIDQTLVPEDQLDALEAYFESSGFQGEVLGHSGGTIGTGSFSYVHLATGTIFVAAEPTRAPSDFFEETFVETFQTIVGSDTWQGFQNGLGDLSFALAAAELDITGGAGADGAPETLLEMGDVTLALEGAMRDLDTDRLSFEDGSTLFIASQSGVQFSIHGDAVQSYHGDNQLIGARGDDVLSGGAGDDKIIGGAGNDQLSGLRGDDAFIGGAGDDHLSGHSGDDRLIGGNGNDSIWGGHDADILHGGQGADLLFGNSGSDLLAGGNGSDMLFGGTGNDSLHGGANEDVLRGNQGNDQMTGGAGNDRLIGGLGDDVLAGGVGQDTLLGGAGMDTFVFQTNSGNDRIVGFENGTDKIDLSALELSYQDLTITEQANGLAAEVAFGDARILVLNADGALSADDFLF